jgi:citrate synthase
MHRGETMPDTVARPPIDYVIATALGVAIESIDDELSYQSIRQWDSHGHVTMMLALEDSLGLEIGPDLMTTLDSVRAIRALAAKRGHSDESATKAGAPHVRSIEAGADPPRIYRGLEDVHFDRSQVTNIDRRQSLLEYRGYSVAELAEHSSFEETAYLLLHGQLPQAEQLAAFSGQLEEDRQAPAPVLALVATLAGAHPMVSLRTAVSALAAFDPDRGDDSAPAMLRTGIRLISQIPLLIAGHHCAREGRPLVMPPHGLSHAAYMLHLLRGGTPPPRHVSIIERDLILHADHSSNAGTFAARIAIGCQADLFAAVTAAMSAFAGRLHGGAVEGTLAMIDAIGSADRAAAYVAEKRSRNEAVFGFGHRVYRAEDPRVAPLRESARRASEDRGDARGFEIVQAVVEAMEPYARHGVGANVDLYSGLAYRMLGLADDLAVPIFTAARIAGWVAHALEQQSNNVLIRPLLSYSGPTGKRYPTAGPA